MGWPEESLEEKKPVLEQCPHRGAEHEEPGREALCKSGSHGYSSIVQGQKGEPRVTPGHGLHLHSRLGVGGGQP